MPERVARLNLWDNGAGYTVPIPLSVGSCQERMEATMNLPIVGRRIAVVSSAVAALLAAGYATSEHRNAQALEQQLAVSQEQTSAAVAAPAPLVSSEDSS